MQKFAWLTALDCIFVDSGDEDLSSECSWHRGVFTPSTSQFIGQLSLPNTIPLVERTLLDYFQLFFDKTIIQRIIDKINRYYLQNLMGERSHISNWQNETLMEMYTFRTITTLTKIKFETIGVLIHCCLHLSSVSISQEIDIRTCCTWFALQIIRIFPAMTDWKKSDQS